MSKIISCLHKNLNLAVNIKNAHHMQSHYLHKIKVAKHQFNNRIGAIHIMFQATKKSKSHKIKVATNQLYRYKILKKWIDIFVRCINDFISRIVNWRKMQIKSTIRRRRLNVFTLSWRNPNCNSKAETRRPSEKYLWKVRFYYTLAKITLSSPPLFLFFSNCHNNEWNNTLVYYVIGKLKMVLYVINNFDFISLSKVNIFSSHRVFLLDIC